MSGISLTIKKVPGSLGGAAVWRLPLAQGRSWRPGIESHIGLRCMEPASPSAYVSASLSLCVTIINKTLKEKKKKDPLLLQTTLQTTDYTTNRK